MSILHGLIALGALVVAGTALADTSTNATRSSAPTNTTQQSAANTPVLTVPPPDFDPPHRRELAPLDDIPLSGSSSQYVHGPNEGPVPGAGPYRLGGPPPNAQGLLIGD